MADNPAATVINKLTSSSWRLMGRAGRASSNEMLPGAWTARNTTPRSTAWRTVRTIRP